MTWKRAFAYACLMMGIVYLFILSSQVLAWGFIWMMTRFPGAFGVFLLTLVGLVLMTAIVYYSYRWMVESVRL